MKGTLGEWSNQISAFWMGANGCEYIAWKGSCHVFVFPIDDYPAPPSAVIPYKDRIETLEQFTEALQTGQELTATYSLLEQPI